MKVTISRLNSSLTKTQYQSCALFSRNYHQPTFPRPDQWLVLQGQDQD